MSAQSHYNANKFALKVVAIVGLILAFLAWL